MTDDIKDLIFDLKTIANDIELCGGEGLNLCDVETINEAADVLGKQIAKEPVNIYVARYALGSLYEGDCPACGKTVNSLQRYCPHCGQKLFDWEEFDRRSKGDGS